jgi:cell division protein FtsI (penicillin-binding protein 3)
VKRLFQRRKKTARPADGPLAWRVALTRRVTMTAMFLALWAAGIEARLIYLQVVRHADLVSRAERQQSRTIPAPAKRGDILDRKGRVLATSVDADTVYAVPTEIADASDVARKLCEAFTDCTRKERQQLADKLANAKAFAYVRRQVSPEEARRVAALNLDGIGFIKESRRFYPNKELAAHLLGYVGVDNVGLGGLESTYDPQIRGKAGTILVHTDARRHAFSRLEHPPTSGSSVELTIDEYLQHIAERELHTGIVENRAAGGTAIIMNPHTGEILAMANEPTFNPNAYRDADENERRNRAVQDLYEPGSTFKVVTASAAIEEKIMPLNTMIDVSGGQIRIDRSRIVHDTHNYGVLSFTDVIVKSSNVGAIKIGFRLGTERLSEYVSRYGFGHPVSPDFPGESPGIVWRPDKWTDSALASVSMGYQVGVTPLQMVAAVSAVANGGEYVEPRVVRAIYQDGRRYAVKPKVVRRTISPDTAAAMTTIMEGVVERGTATRAQIPGYTIAGKTGTSAKLINGHYSSSDWNASFVGFLPSRDPKVAIIVVTDSPHTQGHTGGVVSAPVWRRIAEPTLQYLGIGPTLNPAPPVLVARHDEPIPVDEDNEGVPNRSGDRAGVRLISDDAPGTVPDLQGMSAREAVQKLVKLGFVARISGSGVVVAQEPAAGTPLTPGRLCRLVLDRSAIRRPQTASQP